MPDFSPISKFMDDIWFELTCSPTAAHLLLPNQITCYIWLTPPVTLLQLLPISRLGNGGDFNMGSVIPSPGKQPCLNSFTRNIYLNNLGFALTAQGSSFRKIMTSHDKSLHSSEVMGKQNVETVRNLEDHWDSCGIELLPEGDQNKRNPLNPRWRANVRYGSDATVLWSRKRKCSVQTGSCSDVDQSNTKCIYRLGISWI